jgi:hypothetical protein
MRAIAGELLTDSSLIVVHGGFAARDLSEYLEPTLVPDALMKYGVCAHDDLLDLDYLTPHGGVQLVVGGRGCNAVAHKCIEHPADLLERVVVDLIDHRRTRCGHTGIRPSVLADEALQQTLLEQLHYRVLEFADLECVEWMSAA